LQTIINIIINFSVINKKYFSVKLLPPRADFAQTMTEDERSIMQQHAGYWQEYMQKGIVHVFGPVLDPKGVYGLGIVSVENEEQLKEFIDGDPSLQINKVEYYPMMATLANK
jgi:uncharacterized protein YciI